jgi:hypothetical protein
MTTWDIELTPKGAVLVQQLREAAIEEDAICMQAPNIWDADTIEDSHVAKRGCNGTPPTKDSLGSPPCPLRILCLETALEINAFYGVWGGLSAFERKPLIREQMRNRRANSS